MKFMLSGHCHREVHTDPTEAQALHSRCHVIYPRPTGGVYVCPCPQHQGENRCRVCRYDHRDDIEGYDIATHRCTDNDACTRRMAPASVEVMKEVLAVRAEKRERRRPGRECECNCGGVTKGGRFIPGHDMKLKSALRRAAADGDAAAQIELEKRSWI